MEILIKKLAKGHYIQVKFEDGNTEEFAVGKWHAVVSALRPYLWDKKEKPGKPKKSNKSSNALNTVKDEGNIN